MPALLLRPWIGRLFVTGSFVAMAPAMAIAGWPWGTPAPAPVTTVGPPIYPPSAVPTVTNYQSSTVVPSNTVPAAVAPTLVGPPTTFTPAPVTGVAPVRTVVPQTTTIVGAGGCQPCGTAPRVTGYVPPTYSTNWAQVPTTTYRPVVSVDPATGLPINAVQPCTTTTWQARRVPNTWWGGLWPTTSAPPTVVAYTPATISAFPQARIVTNYAPPVTTIVAPRPVVITQFAPAPVVTQFAPAPTVTQFAPAPLPTTTIAPSTVTVPTQPCPHGCPNGQCGQSSLSVPPNTTLSPSSPATVYSQGTSPANIAPSLNDSHGSYPRGTIVPNSGNGRDAASVAPRLDSSSVEGTTRSYAPTEYDNEPVVPVSPPAENRVIETPRIEAPQLQSPGTNGTSMRPPTSSPFVPFARPAEKPASTVVPERNLRLVPDPDAEKLELRRDAIPNLIKPGDRTTQAAPMRHVVSTPATTSVPMTTAMKPVEPQSPRMTPASISKSKLDDSGWRSVGP